MATNTQNPSAPTSTEQPTQTVSPMQNVIMAYVALQEKENARKEKEKIESANRCAILINSNDPLLVACGLLGSAWDVLTK